MISGPTTTATTTLQLHLMSKSLSKLFTLRVNINIEMSKQKKKTFFYIKASCVIIFVKFFFFSVLNVIKYNLDETNSFFFSSFVLCLFCEIYLFFYFLDKLSFLLLLKIFCCSTACSQATLQTIKKKSSLKSRRYLC